MKKYKKHKKRIGQNALKSAMESTEHSFKAVSCADENKNVILSGKKKEREKYDHTHNLEYLQREQENAKIKILEKKM